MTDYVPFADNGVIAQVTIVDQEGNASMVITDSKGEF